MANTYVVRLVGGPCDGTDRTITSATLAAGHLTCKGTLYLKSKAFPGEELIVFATSDAIGTATKSISDKNVAVAWSRWMRALGHKGPAAHNRIAKAAARVNRIAR